MSIRVVATLVDPVVARANLAAVKVVPAATEVNLMKASVGRILAHILHLQLHGLLQLLQGLSLRLL